MNQDQSLQGDGASSWCESVCSLAHVSASTMMWQLCVDCRRDDLNTFSSPAFLDHFANFTRTRPRYNSKSHPKYDEPTAMLGLLPH